LDATAHQQTVDSILDTVGLPRRPVSTEMRKVNDRPVSEIVENFEEFSAWAQELAPEVVLD
ncbi:MAG: hypothetical protein AAGK21_08805, partial [Bacteroidota bacterium]